MDDPSSRRTVAGRSEAGVGQTTKAALLPTASPQDLSEWACIYIRYIQILRKLETAYDQMVQPQKRLDMRKALEACIGGGRGGLLVEAAPGGAWLGQQARAAIPPLTPCTQMLSRSTLHTQHRACVQTSAGVYVCVQWCVPLLFPALALATSASSPGAVAPPLWGYPCDAHTAHAPSHGAPWLHMWAACMPCALSDGACAHF